MEDRPNQDSSNNKGKPTEFIISFQLITRPNYAHYSKLKTYINGNFKIVLTPNTNSFIINYSGSAHSIKKQLQNFFSFKFNFFVSEITPNHT